MKPAKPKPRIEPPGTIPRAGDRIVKIKRCRWGAFVTAPIGTRATVVGVKRDPWDCADHVVTDQYCKGANVSPDLSEFEERGGWRVCKRRNQ